MAQPGKLVPDCDIETLSGERGRLWDYRQKSHVIVLRGAGNQPAFLKKWKEEVQRRHPRLDWLRAIPLFAEETLHPSALTVDLIDRYGRLHKTLPVDPDSIAAVFDQIEEEYVYYESRHC